RAFDEAALPKEPLPVVYNQAVPPEFFDIIYVDECKGGAGEYFTPRPLIAAIVECVQPRPGEIVADPACGTGGFLLAAHHYVATHYPLDKNQKKHLRYDALRGVELVDGVARLCAMNLFLKGIGPDDDTR